MSRPLRKCGPCRAVKTAKRGLSPRSRRRGIGADVDTPARQPCCESRILALATDGERQLIVRYHDTRGSQALIDHGHRGHLCRR